MSPVIGTDEWPSMLDRGAPGSDTRLAGSISPKPAVQVGHGASSCLRRVPSAQTPLERRIWNSTNRPVAHAAPAIHQVRPPNRTAVSVALASTSRRMKAELRAGMRAEALRPWLSPEVSGDETGIDRFGRDSPAVCVVMSDKVRAGPGGSEGR